MYDITGKQIDPGNVIAYPQRQGSSMWMNLALVISSGRSPANNWCNKDDLKPYILVIKIPQQTWMDKPGEQFQQAPRTSVLRRVERAVIVAQSLDHLNMPPDIQSNLRLYFAKHPSCEHLV